jgi:TPR repeat protein
VHHESEAREVLFEQPCSELEISSLRSGLVTAVAQHNLSICYARGEGVEKDEAKAARLYRQALEQGNVLAPYRPGTCCALGKGVEADVSQAAQLFRQAAE